MRIVVSTKRVPDPEQPVALRPDGAAVDPAGVSFVLNPFDAIALEEALRIRERRADPVEVVAVGIGGPGYEETLRTALAMGADRAVHVAADDSVGPWNVARVLAAVVHRQLPELVLMGKQAVDDDCNQAGQFLAALLDWPQATFVSHLQFEDNPPARVRVLRETDGGLETVCCKLPAVVTADLRLNEPRYASLPSLMKARKKSIESLTLAQLGVEVERRVEIVNLDLAGSRRSCTQVRDVAELVERLRHEAKVL